MPRQVWGALAGLASFFAKSCNRSLAASPNSAFLHSPAHKRARAVSVAVVIAWAACACTTGLAWTATPRPPPARRVQHAPESIFFYIFNIVYKRFWRRRDGQHVGVAKAKPCLVDGSCSAATLASRRGMERGRPRRSRAPPSISSVFGAGVRSKPSRAANSLGKGGEGRPRPAPHGAVGAHRGDQRGARRASW